jgi:hypothetical protein
LVDLIPHRGAVVSELPTADALELFELRVMIESDLVRRAVPLAQPAEAGAIRLARAMGPGHTIVTLLCDAGQRYQSKLFNPEFLRSKGLPVPGWLA